jgi:pyrroline-5-carboxylate reductase
MQQTIAFVGGGNMARALVGGLLKAGWPTDRIVLADPDVDQRRRIMNAWPGVTTYIENREAVDKAHIVLFAVKPQALSSCAQDLASSMRTKRPLVVSIAAGIRVAALQNWLGGDLPVVRCMPNTPALIGCGATALYAGENTTQQQREMAEQVMRSVGVTVWLQREAELDIVTALSGSGPAYFFFIMEILEEAAVKLGLSRDTASRLCVQTALGAAKLASESEESRFELRARVTSKGGTTEKALEVLQHGGIRNLFESALAAAAGRASDLSDESERLSRA